MEKPPASPRDHSAGPDPEGGLIFFISGGFWATFPIALYKRLLKEQVGKRLEEEKRGRKALK